MRDCGNLPSRIRSGFGLASLSYFHDTGATPFGLFRSGIAMLQTVATTRYVHRGLKGPPHPVTVPTNFHRTPYVTRLVYGARATSFEISQSRETSVFLLVLPRIRGYTALDRSHRFVISILRVHKGSLPLNIRLDHRSVSPQRSRRAAIGQTAACLGRWVSHVSTPFLCDGGL